MLDKKVDKIKIAMVGYYNTLPFSYGLEKFRDQYDLILDVPSRCMSYFDSGDADVALVPVATLLGRSDFKIITDYCIGCVGDVGTVCLYSNRPVAELDHIILDSDSRTSQLLTKVLCKHYWNITTTYDEQIITNAAYDELSENRGVLMIGDKAFGAAKHYKYVYDLGVEWESMTQLPFVFAVWIARAGLHSSVVDELNDVLGLGVHNIEAVLENNQGLANQFDLKAYFMKYIDYNFDTDKKKALDKYSKLGIEIIKNESQQASLF